MQPDTSVYYGTISRLLHWLMALAFLFMFGTAILWNINEDYFSLMNYHKAAGFILLILLVIRAIWAIMNAKNRVQNPMVAKLGHLALYVLMLIVPLVGFLRQIGRAKGDMDVFGLFSIPAFSEKSEWMMQAGNLLHGKLGWLLLALVVGHVAVAIVHQVRGEKVLNRMAGPRR